MPVPKRFQQGGIDTVSARLIIVLCESRHDLYMRVLDETRHEIGGGVVTGGIRLGRLGYIVKIRVQLSSGAVTHLLNGRLGVKDQVFHANDQEWKRCLLLVVFLVPVVPEMHETFVRVGTGAKFDVHGVPFAATRSHS